MVGQAGEEAAPLVGRVQELNLLTALLDEVATRGQALVLRGVPGIGKSRLLSATVRTAREQGMRVLTATGVQSEAHLPFAGLHQLLRPLLGEAADLPAPQREALYAAFGMSTEPASNVFLIALATLELLASAAERAPVLVIADDAQWLDGSTCDVLAFV